MSDCMTQEDAMNMDNEQAIQILRPFMNMMRDQNGCPISDAYFAFGKAIKALERPRMRGRWVGADYDGYADGNPVYYTWKCSVCNCLVEDEEPTWNYCPNCGAEMGGQDET